MNVSENDFSFAYHLSMNSCSQFSIVGSNSSLEPLGTSLSAKQWHKKSLWDSYPMNLNLRQLVLSTIFSFCISVNDVNPEKGVSVSSFPLMLVLKHSSNNALEIGNCRYIRFDQVNRNKVK